MGKWGNPGIEEWETELGLRQTCAPECLPNCTPVCYPSCSPENPPACNPAFWSSTNIRATRDK